MKKHFIFYFFVILSFLVPGKSHSQVGTISGNLVRIKFDQQKVSLNDTLGFWENSKYQYGFKQQFYYDHFTLAGRDYMLKTFDEYFDSPVFTSYRGFYNAENAGKSRSFANTGLGWDIIEPYWVTKTIIIETKNGLWLLNGDLGKTFISNNDSLYTYNLGDPKISLDQRLITIAGTVADKALGVFEKENTRDKYDLLLIDLSESPNIDPAKAVKIEFSDNTSPVKIVLLYNDLYLVQPLYTNDLNVYRFRDDTMTLVKQVFKSDYESHPSGDKFWDFRNNTLYTCTNDKLQSYSYSPSDTTFINPKELLTQLAVEDYGIDRNLRYAAKIEQGTLGIFDIDKADYISKIDISAIKDAIRPVIDFPWVFVHQVKTRTDAVGPKSNIIMNYELTAYPNPFNPATTISYSIPKQSAVDLRVFDLLGREVSVLVNEEQNAGQYKVQFDGSNLPSGLYLYQLQSGNYRETKKLLLMK